VTSRFVRFVSYLALRDPRLLLDYVRWYVGSRQRQQAEPPFQYAGTPLSPEQAKSRLVERLGAQPEGTALSAARANAPKAAAKGDALQSMAGDMSLGELLYVIIRAARPDVIIETGVAQGITSAYILAGLTDNEWGHLHSIDLPSRSMIRSGVVGAAVPEDLRDRWTYHWGASRRLLPGVLDALGPQMGLFVHDSDHSYTNMCEELERAWARGDKGTWIVADDVQLHAAFEEFARSRNAEPMYVSQDAKTGWTGMVTKS
jgi:predicted O-methyltransferase YrrM